MLARRPLSIDHPASHPQAWAWDPTDPKRLWRHTGECSPAHAAPGLQEDAGSDMQTLEAQADAAGPQSGKEAVHVRAEEVAASWGFGGPAGV